MPSSSRPTTAVQTIPLGYDVRDPCVLSPGAIATLPLFLVSRCQRGREFRDLCRVFVCFASVSSLWCVFSPFALFGFVSVRPKFQTYGVRHMLPYLYLCLSSTLVSYELLVYHVILPALMYPMLRLLDYKI